MTQSPSMVPRISSLLYSSSFIIILKYVLYVAHSRYNNDNNIQFQGSSTMTTSNFKVQQSSIARLNNIQLQFRFYLNNKHFSFSLTFNLKSYPKIKIHHLKTFNYKLSAFNNKNEIQVQVSTIEIGKITVFNNSKQKKKTNRGKKERQIEGKNVVKATG
ncbi:hypothetical protein RYX36_013665 [Vicia faba]